jgi:hypothetical protein
VAIDAGGCLAPELQSSFAEVEPCHRRLCQLGDPWAREAQRREERAASVALVRG